MAKTHFQAVSTAALTIENVPGATAGASTLGATTVSALTTTGAATVGTTLGVTGATTLTGALALGTGNAVSAAAGVASTNKIAIVVNGTTYYLLATTVA